MSPEVSAPTELRGCPPHSASQMRKLREAQGLGGGASPGWATAEPPAAPGVQSLLSPQRLGHGKAREKSAESLT